MNESINTMARRIKSKRLELGYTQEELGKLIGTKRAAVNKYESGQVENMKRSTIEKLSTIFNVSPTWLMGFDVPQEQKLDKKATIILKHFENLNDLGQSEACKRVEELTNIPKYSNYSEPELRAAHIDKDLLNDEQMKLIEQDFEDMDKW